MSRPAYSTTLDSLIAAGAYSQAWRVLTCDLDWPAGDPPFAAGDAVSVPALTEPPPAYAAATFDAAVWTDCTALVDDWRYNQDAALQCDQLSLSVPASWAGTAMANVWREMRAIRLQGRAWGPAGDTGWFDVAWCLSDGYQETWDPAKGRRYQVNAKDVLKLAGVEILGAGTGVSVYQPDRVPVGTFASPHVMTHLTPDPDDAMEFAVTDLNGAIHPNWADRPGAQFWAYNVPGATEPIRLAVGEAAVQAVFGEGVLRISKSWLTTSAGTYKDYRAGLGYGVGEVPDVRCVLYRFAHPAATDRNGDPVVSDIAGGLTVTGLGSGSGVWFVEVDTLLSTRPAGLTLMAQDGTGRRWQTYALAFGDGTTTISVYGEAPDDWAVGPGEPAITVQYGDANLATDVIHRWLIECGYQTSDSTAPLYATAPEAPDVSGTGRQIVLPPLVYHAEDGTSVLAAIEELRRRGYLPPDYYTRATAGGQVITNSVGQLADGNAGIVPLTKATQAQVDRSDAAAYTRVIARGLARQATDYGSTATAIADVAEGSGGLPAPPTSSPYTTYGDIERQGWAVRSSPTGHQYLFALADILTDRPGSTDSQTLRPWGWLYHLRNDQQARYLQSLWEGKALCEITWASAVDIHALELWQSNPYIGGWQRASLLGIPDPGWTPGDKLRPIPSDASNWHGARLDRQGLGVQYWDGATWQWLASWVEGQYQFPDVSRVQADDFDTRGPVSTTALRVVCQTPTMIQSGTHDEGWWYCIVGVWLARLRVWSSSEIRRTAEIGVTAPYDATPWPAVRARVRRRTWVLPDAAPWANSTADVDSLALAWLKEFTRDMAPRPVRAYRPDLRLWDTASFALPGQAAQNYLVPAVTHTASGLSDVRLTSYTAPFYEEGA